MCGSTTHVGLEGSSGALTHSGVLHLYSNSAVKLEKEQVYFRTSRCQNVFTPFPFVFFTLPLPHAGTISVSLFPALHFSNSCPPLVLSLLLLAGSCSVCSSWASGGQSLFCFDVPSLPDPLEKNKGKHVNARFCAHSPADWGCV